MGCLGNSIGAIRPRQPPRPPGVQPRDAGKMSWSAFQPADRRRARSWCEFRRGRGDVDRCGMRIAGGEILVVVESRAPVRFRYPGFSKPPLAPICVVRCPVARSPGRPVPGTSGLHLLVSCQETPRDTPASCPVVSSPLVVEDDRESIAGADERGEDTTGHEAGVSRGGFLAGDEQVEPLVPGTGRPGDQATGQRTTQMGASGGWKAGVPEPDGHSLTPRPTRISPPAIRMRTGLRPPAPRRNSHQLRARRRSAGWNALQLIFPASRGCTPGGRGG